MDLYMGGELVHLFRIKKIFLHENTKRYNNSWNDSILRENMCLE